MTNYLPTKHDCINLLRLLNRFVPCAALTYVFAEKWQIYCTYCGWDSNKRTYSVMRGSG